MKTRVRFAVVGFICAIALPGLVFGQAERELKIGFVNVARLLAESPQAGASMAALQEEFAPRQRDIVAKQNEFKEKKDRIGRDLEVMGAEERRNAERDLRKDERDLARRQEEFTEDFNLRRNEELGKLQRDLLQEVQAFATRANYDLVLSDGVLYVNQALDITQAVLEGLQASFERKAGGTD